MSLQASYPYYLANTPQAPNADLVVTDKFTQQPAANVALADAQTIDTAIQAADRAAEPMARLKAYQRKDVLIHCVSRFTDRFDELAHALCIEAGKPIKDARGEVTRLIDTFVIAAEESTRILGEVLPMDISARAADYSGLWKPFPIGPCSFISPFNFPLNLVAHKVAPAIAVGCPFILKPASLTPIGALIIGEILAETDLPEGAFSILPCRRDGADLFTTDARLKLLSFTGSQDVGWDLKNRAGKKKVVLELGGNAACIIDHDADVRDAVNRNIIGAFYQSGQSCISVQRIIVHQSIYNEFRDQFTSAAAELKAGDPKDESTFIGPIISDKEADRIESWINQAVENGANLLTGGTRNDNVINATVLENVPHNLPLSCAEAFGPVVTLEPFDTFDEALNLVNASDFGLQAGVFTNNIQKAQHAFSTLDVGGVIINDVPSFRVDHMPYGGVKESGLGREGIRWAIQDMTEPRLLLIRNTMDE